MDLWKTHGVASRDRTGVRPHRREVWQRSRADEPGRWAICERRSEGDADKKRNRLKSESISSGHDQNGSRFFYCAPHVAVDRRARGYSCCQDSQSEKTEQTACERVTGTSATVACLAQGHCHLWHGLEPRLQLIWTTQFLSLRCVWPLFSMAS